jgi:hypothetical protein
VLIDDNRAVDKPKAVDVAMETVEVDVGDDD